MMQKEDGSFVLYPAHWKQVTLIAVLTYVGMGLLIAHLPNPMLPGAILALNMTVIVIAGGLGGDKAGLLTGLLGTAITFLVKRVLHIDDPFELYAILPHTLMGYVAGLLARRKVSRITVASAILVGHTLNICTFLFRRLMPVTLVREVDFWNGLLAEVALDILVIALVLGLFEQRARGRAGRLPGQRHRRIVGMILATALTVVLIVAHNRHMPLAPYLFFLPVVLAASMIGPLAPFLFAAALSYPLIETVSRVGLHESGAEVPLIISLNFIALTVGELVERWRNEQLLAEKRLQKLQRAYELLTETDRMKQEIIQNVSHELRTPLTILLGYLELLSDGSMGAMTEEQQRLLTKALLYGRKLAQLVEQITVLQQVGDGQMSYRAVDMLEIVRTVLSRYETMAQQRNCRFLLRNEAEEETKVVGDPVLLEHVIAALIDNAIKFSPHGGVIEVRLWRDGERLYCTVKDEGIGIAEEMKPKLFRRFYQVDGTMTRRYGGMGIGLSVVREVVLASGGNVWLESAAGKGTTVGFWLPLSPLFRVERERSARLQEVQAS